MAISLTKPTAQETVYSDFKTSFEVHPVNGDLIMIKNEQAVTRSLRNIMLTGKYETFFNHMFGAGLQKYLFENVTEMTGELIKESVKLSIRNYEPRAEDVTVEVYIPHDQNGYEVTIVFRVRTLPTPVTISQFLKRIR